MITLIEGLPENVVGLRYEGEVTGADYKSTVFPAVDKMVKDHEDLRIVMEFNKNFKSINLHAILDDASAALKYFRHWKKIALSSDNSELNHLAKALSFIFPGELKVFPTSALDEAIAWVSKAR